MLPEKTRFAKAVMGRIKAKPKRSPKTFYLTETHLKEFLKVVERLPGNPTPSEVVDSLMVVFSEGQKGSKNHK